ncbi:MAG: hypothetical protein KDJ52_20260, partial [Anaerolineae bacterium]|nr:hypothetical protein [Anaerolineae bacterium]
FLLRFVQHPIPDFCLLSNLSLRKVSYNKKDLRSWANEQGDSHFLIENVRPLSLNRAIYYCPVTVTF